MKPDYTEFLEEAGGEVRYFQRGDKWSWVCAMGDGVGEPSLEAAQRTVRQYIAAAAEPEEE